MESFDFLAKTMQREKGQFDTENRELGTFRSTSQLEENSQTKENSEDTTFVPLCLRLPEKNNQSEESNQPDDISEQEDALVRGNCKG